jgi:hypothetical protein
MVPFFTQNHPHFTIVAVHTQYFVRQLLTWNIRHDARTRLRWYPTDPSPACLSSQRAYRDDDFTGDNDGEDPAARPDPARYRSSIRDPLPLTLDASGIQEPITAGALLAEATASRRNGTADGGGGFDLILCINMIHIAPWSAAVGLFRAASQLLGADSTGTGNDREEAGDDDGGGGGVLLLYGPFRVNGTMVESNVYVK